MLPNLSKILMGFYLLPGLVPLAVDGEACMEQRQQPTPPTQIHPEMTERNPPGNQRNYNCKFTLIIYTHYLTGWKKNIWKSSVECLQIYLNLILHFNYYMKFHTRESICVSIYYSGCQPETASDTEFQTCRNSC